MDRKGDTDREFTAVEAVMDESREKYGADEVTKYYSKLDVTVRVPPR